MADLKGWSLPQSATGQSALVGPPPWHYSGEIICAEFTADAQAVARLLPAAFTATPDGAGAFVFVDWCSASENDPRVAADPAHCQYKEAFLLLHASWRGEPVSRVPYIWVNSDLSLVRGLIQGFPKKLGEIHMTRAVEVGRGGSKKEPGARFAAHVSRLGRLLADIQVSIERRMPEGFMPPFWRLPMIHTRLWPAVGSGQPAVYEFQRATITGIEVGPVYAGSATLEFGAAPFEELHELGPVTVTRGFVHSLAFSYIGGVTEPIAPA